MDDEKFQLPCLPQAILPWSQEEKKNLIIKKIENAHPDVNFKRRIFSKLLNIWHLYGHIRNNQLIIDTINADNLSEREKLLADCIVYMVDFLGKVLSSSHTTDELSWLVSELSKEELEF